MRICDKLITSSPLRGRPLRLVGAIRARINVGSQSRSGCPVGARINVGSQSRSGCPVGARINVGSQSRSGCPVGARINVGISVSQWALSMTRTRTREFLALEFTSI